MLHKNSLQYTFYSDLIKGLKWVEKWMADIYHLVTRHFNGGTWKSTNLHLTFLQNINIGYLPYSKC